MGKTEGLENSKACTMRSFPNAAVDDTTAAFGNDRMAIPSGVGRHDTGELQAARSALRTVPW